MGAEQSKPSYSGGSNKLGSGSASAAPRATTGYQEREAMAEAAERRAKALQSKSSTSPPSRSPNATPPAPSSASSPVPTANASYDPNHPESPSGLVPAPEPNMSLNDMVAAVPTPSGREALAEAAERRAKAASARGTHASNPRRGELANKAGKLNKTPTPTSEPERLIYE